MQKIGLKKGVEEEPFTAYLYRNYVTYRSIIRIRYFRTKYASCRLTKPLPTSLPPTIISYSRIANLRESESNLIILAAYFLPSVLLVAYLTTENFPLKII